MAEQVIFFRVEAEGVGDLVDQLGLLRREATQLQKDMRKATDPAEYVKLNRELENNRSAQKEVTAAIREQQKVTRETTAFAEGSYRKLDAELARLRRSYKELSQAEREGPGGAESLKRIQALDNELKQLDATMGQFQRNVGNYPGGGFGQFAQGIQGLGGPLGNFVGQVQGLMSPLQDVFGAFKGMGGAPIQAATAGVEGLSGAAGSAGAAMGGLGAGAIAASAGVAAAALVVGKGVQNAMQFEDAFAQLSATLGVSGAEADALKDRIDALQTITLTGGAEIVSTSTEIADAFTVVGSAAPQLLKNQAALQAVSKEVIVFSKSAGTDLAGAAKVVTGAINLFGLEASEASRVINTLAAGEKEGSATTLEAAEALEKAGGAARISGVNIEETTAAIQLLAKDSLKGSEAGTQLRNVFLNLATADVLPAKAQEAFRRTGVDVKVLTDTTRPLTERLAELSKIEGDTAAVTEIFGKENVNAALSLIKYKDQFGPLTEAISGTNVAYDQASTKQATLSARIENLTNQFNNALTIIGQFFLPVIEAIFTRVQEVGAVFSDLGAAIGEITGGFGDASDAGQAWADFSLKLNRLILGPFLFSIKAFTAAIREIPAAWAFLTEVIRSFPQFLSQTLESGLTKIRIFTLETKAAFKNAAEFITFGYANGGQELLEEASALRVQLKIQQMDDIDLFKKAGAAYQRVKDEQAAASKAAADQAAAASQTEQAAADDLIKKLQEEEKKKKEQEEKDNKRDEDRKKRDQDRVENLTTLRAELAKVEAELAKFSDPALVPSELISKQKSLRSEIAGLEKDINAFYNGTPDPADNKQVETLALLRQNLELVKAELDKFDDPSLVPTDLLNKYSSLLSQIKSLEDQLGKLYGQTTTEVEIPVTPVLGKGGTENIGDILFGGNVDEATAEVIKKRDEAIAKAREDEAKQVEADRLKKVENAKKTEEAIQSAAFELAQDAADAIFKLDEENAQRRLDKQLEQLDEQEAQQLALVEGNAQAEQQVREDFAAQREQLEREAFEKKKQRDIAQAIMNAALAITQAFASTPFPASLIAAALVGAQTAIQVATIAAQEFALGGRIGDGFDAPKAEHGIFVGPSHSGGGINTRLSGRRVNVEGGEFFERLADGSSIVVNKKSTSAFKRALLAQAGRNYPGKLSTLSAINQYGGGVPLMATGGIVTPMAGGGAQSTAQMELLGLALDKLSNRVPVLTLQSFDTVNSRATQVKTLQGL
jgi:TP901 family phage tail tape measure protein